VGQYPPEYLVAADEAAVNILTTYRTNGWALRGLQAHKRCCFIRGTRYAIGIYTGFSSLTIFRYSMLPGLTMGGIIYSHIKMGGYNGDQFIEWLEGLLQIMNPYPAPNSVLIFDNCRIHHVEGVEELCEAR
jgi:hypothetical protein